MSEKVFNKVRVVGCSAESIEKAIQVAVDKAGHGKTGHGWLEVVEVRGATTDGKVVEWQVTVDLAVKSA